MRESRRLNWLLTLAAATIFISLVAYSVYFWEWYRGPRPGVLAKPQQSESLVLAREKFRSDYLRPEAHIRLAEALFRTGRDIDGFYILSSARELFGEGEFLRAHAMVVLYEGGHFLQGKEYDPSKANEARLKKKLRKKSRDPDTLNYLAHIEAGRGNHTNAVKLLDRGLSSSPKHPGLLAYRAELAQYAASDKDGPLPFLARIADSHPRTYEGRMALKELGKVAQGTRSGDQRAALARETLAELFKKHPKNPEIFSALAMSAWGRGDMKSVRALVRDTQSRFRSHAGASQIQGALALLEKRTGPALRHFMAAWEQNPQDLYSAEKIAQIHFKRRSSPEASLPFYIALYRNDPRYEDGVTAEVRIRRILDQRRAGLLRGIGDEGIRRYLSAHDGSLRAEACEHAADSKDPKWIEHLFRLLDDDTEIVRHNADYALYQIGKENLEAITLRRSEWLSSPKVFVRVRALNLFADLERENTFVYLQDALRDTHPAGRFLSKILVLDHYYKDYPPARKIRGDYLKREKHPDVLRLYSRMDKARGEEE